MKLITLLSTLALMFVTMTGQTKNKDTNENLILGTYFTAENKGKVVVTKTQHGKYVGTLVWTKTPGKLDTKNPDPAERSKKMAGKMILKDFTYSGNSIWENGTIYDPESGKTYSCKITRLNNGDLKVRGFIGISLLGRTTLWKRAK